MSGADYSMLLCPICGGNMDESTGPPYRQLKCSSCGYVEGMSETIIEYYRKLRSEKKPDSSLVSEETAKFPHRDYHEGFFGMKGTHCPICGKPAGSPMPEEYRKVAKS